MSLINEALKKARDKNPPSDAPQPLHAPLRPTINPPPKSASNGMWVVATLVILGLAGLFWFIFRSTKSDASHRENLSTTQKPQQPPSGTGGPRNVSAVTPPPPAVEAPPTLVRPPPQPVVETPPPPPQQQIPVARLPRPSLRISATMVFKDSRTAIINGQEYLEGEEVEGATVLEIKLNGVRLRFNGEEYFLKNN